MGEKDISQKNFESYNDVVADIVNGSLFDGEDYIKEESLIDAQPFSQYKADDGTLHELERDVAKYCVDTNCNIRLAMIGVENQIAIDFDMPLRVMGYDGISYRDEINLDKIVVDKSTGQKRRIRHKRYPVLTLILYFGENPWKKPLCLYDVIDVPDKLKPYINDFKLNIIDVPRLTPEQVKRYKGDFQIIADYFVQRNSGKEYVPPDKPIQHVDSMLKLMSVLTRDKRYSDWLNEDSATKEEMNMCEVLDKIVARGEARGEIRGTQKTLVNLVKKNLLSIRDAALEAGMSEEAFKKLAKAM
ncbi:MAG: Rpn family recombination-promoting nuclease/putative transposase [Selenomonadaceae bacterium]|nr:Rpn family recombination-promoting nuclease/putative transposase [Selenomonadaceae bacterium]